MVGAEEAMVAAGAAAVDLLKKTFPGLCGYCNEECSTDDEDDDPFKERRGRPHAEKVSRMVFMSLGGE